MKIRRTIVIVLDSVGCGAAPDACSFNDAGAHTLRNAAHGAGGLNVPVMEKMGLGRIAHIEGVTPAAFPSASWGRMTGVSPGKDTTTGHWEMAGIILDEPFALFAEGFPDAVIQEFIKKTGRGVLANRAASGTEIINELGDEHVRTGYWIVYTSVDSVFQIAAHEDVVPVEELYEACRTARKILDPYRVARVIARPFEGTSGNYVRTTRRKDFSIEPVAPTCLDMISEAEMPVVAVGKIGDIFAYRGITKAIHTDNNEHGMDVLEASLKSYDTGMIMVNLVDFDMLWGHRRDAGAYAHGLEAFDKRLGPVLGSLKQGDLLFITADHGCDPCHHGTDHTREQVPLLATGPGLKPVPLGIRETFADLGQTVCDALGVTPVRSGTSFMKLIKG